MSSPKVEEAPSLSDLKISATLEERAAYRARLVETGERSFIDERMNVKLPDHLHGEWVGVDDASQWGARSKGFVSGEEFIKSDNFLHAHPEGGRIGDVKFMVCPRWQYEERETVNRNIIARKHNLNVDAPTIATYNQMAASGINPMRDEVSQGHAISGDELAKIIRP